MQTSKRIWSLILALTMVFSVFGGTPLTAFAEDDLDSLPLGISITSADNYTCNEGEGGTFQVTAEGAENIEFALDGEPGGVSIGSESGILSVNVDVPADEYEFTVKASDADDIAAEAVQSFTLTVEEGDKQVSGPTRAPLANPPDPDDVCSISGTAFTSFKAAVDSVGSGGTATIVMTANATETTPIVVDNKTININLGNFDLVFLDGLSLDNGSTITYTNAGSGGLIVNYLLSVVGNSACDITYFEGYRAEAGSSGEITVNGDVLINVPDGGISATNTGSVVTVTGNVEVVNAENAEIKAESNGTIEIGGYVEMTGNNTKIYVTDGSNITIGGSVELTGDSAYINVEGYTLTIGGDVMLDGEYAYIEAYGGEVDITGDVTLSGNYSYVRADNFGTLTVGGDVSVTLPPFDTGGVEAFNGGTVTIGGSVTMAASGYPAVNAADGGTVTIDGAVTVTTPATNYVKINTSYLGSGDITSPTTKTGYLTYKNGDSTVWVLDSSAGNVCRNTATGNLYSSFKAAVDAIAAGGTATIQMIANSNETTPVVVDNQTINLNLGSYTLDLDTGGTSNSTALTVRNGGKVILTGTGTGKFNVTGVFAGLIVSGPGSEATVDNVVSTGTGGGRGVSADNEGIATVRGNVTSAGTYGVISELDAIVIVGGNVRADNDAGILAGATVTVTGSVNCKNDAVYAYDTAVVITGAITTTSTGCGVDASGTAKVTVNGNISTPNYDGVIVDDEAQVTVNGTITPGPGRNAIEFGNFPADPGVPSTTKPGYIEYTDGWAYVWVGTAVPVCQIGTIGYPTLDDALNSVSSGGSATIKLLANIDSDRIVIDNKKITIDLNGKTLNVTHDTISYNTLSIRYNGELHTVGAGALNIGGDGNGLGVNNNCKAIINGNINTNGPSAVRANPGSTVIINGNINTEGAVVADWGSLTINGNVTLIGDDSYITSNGTDARIYIDGDVVKTGDSYSTATSGSGGYLEITGDVTANDLTDASYSVVDCGNENSKIIIGGNITTSGTGAYAYDRGEITVNGTITAANYISIWGTVKNAGDGVTDSAKPGYLKYSGGAPGSGIVWVLNASAGNVAFTAAQTGGISGTADSTGIVLTFSQAVTGLSVSNITITNSTGAAVKGTLSGSGKTYTIGLASVTTQGTVTVSVSNFGTYTVVSGPQAVTVYKNTAPTQTVTGVTVNPSTATVQKGTTRQFNATVQGTNSPSQNVAWSVNSTAGSSISASGLLSVAAGETAATLTVTATSVADNTKFGTATVTVSNTPVPTVTSITITPASATMSKGLSQQFSAVVNGTNNPGQGVTWSVNSTSGSTISATGLLSVAAGETASNLTVRATSTVDTTVSGAATVTVLGVSYYIIFDANGGTVNPVSMYTGTDGKLSLLPVPTRYGMIFDGWFTQKTGGTHVTSNYVFTSSATVYAHWTTIPSPSWSGDSDSDSGGTSYATVPSQPSTSQGSVNVYGVNVPYTMDNTSGTMNVNLTAGLLDQILAAAGGANPIVINLGGPASMMGIIIRFPPSWFAAHPGVVFDLRTTIGGFRLDNNVARNFPSQTTTGRISLRKGSIILSAEQDSKAVTWNNPAAPVMLYMAYTPAKDEDTSAIILYNRVTGETVANSYYSDGRVYGSVKGTGEYDARNLKQGYVRSSSSGAYSVHAAALAKFAGLRYEHDTIDENSVQVRLYLDKPAKITKNTMVSGYVKGADVDRIQNIFGKWFGNKTRVIHMDQTGPWGQPVQIAAKIDLSGMDDKKLYFYLYDKANNSYTRIEKPDYWIDKNGYLHFTTEYAGDIIISEGPLEKK